MLEGRILQRPHSQIEDVACHFPTLRHRVEARELNRLDALHVLELVQVALINRTLEQVAYTTHHLLFSSSAFLACECFDVVALVCSNHFVELFIIPLKFLVLFE